MDDVVAALAEQVEELREMVGGLDDGGLATPSACEGWSVADVLLHLAQTNEAAVASARDELAAPPAGCGGRHVPARRRRRRRGGGRRAGRPAAEVRARWDRSAATWWRPSTRSTPPPGSVGGRRDGRPQPGHDPIAETWIHTATSRRASACAGSRPTASATSCTWCTGRSPTRSPGRAGAGRPGPLRGHHARQRRHLGLRRRRRPDRRDRPAVDLCLVAGQRLPAADTALAATGPDGADVLALMRTFA